MLRKSIPLFSKEARRITSFFSEVVCSVMLNLPYRKTEIVEMICDLYILCVFFFLDKKETKNQDGKIAPLNATRHRLPSILRAAS